MKVTFVNQTKTDSKIHEKLIKKIFSKVKDKGIFTIVFVTNEEIKKINKEYRNIDKVTDVISFALNDNDEMSFMDSNELGDIFISIDKATTQALEYGHSLERELGFLAVHGYLHLKGYDHVNKEDEEKMITLQEEILKKAKLERKKN